MIPILRPNMMPLFALERGITGQSIKQIPSHLIACILSLWVYRNEAEAMKRARELAERDDAESEVTAESDASSLVNGNA